MPNPYDTLGVPVNATEADINKRFKEDSRKYHPDKQHNKSQKHIADYRERYERPAEAAEWLRNEDRREAWDNRLGIPYFKRAKFERDWKETFESRGLG
jgi:DnaJ-class molecular chaperone